MAPNDLTQYLSTAAAAELLAVSVSTIKRWVDEGILPAHVTAGGHRKLLRAEVLAILRQGHLPRSTTFASDPGTGVGLPDLSAAGKDLSAALLDGLAGEAKRILLRLYHAGVPLETVADEVISPVMAAVGHLWQTNRIDVWHEHRATLVCTEALAELKDAVGVRAERNRPVALGGAPAGDPYSLATLLAQMALIDAGWDAHNLGPNTPVSSLTKAVRELRPRLVWVSASSLSDVPTFMKEFCELYRTAEQTHTAVVVGGPALTDSVRSSMRYHAHGDGLTHLIAFARVLHPRPRRPVRGRPV